MNENASNFAYMIDFAFLLNSYSLWHARLGHVNVSYARNMKTLGSISRISSTNNNTKCQICAETKLIKKSCVSIERHLELLELIHTDLGVLKQTITRGSKKYFVTCNIYR